ncbi:MAG: hypothetical protein U0R17_05310 [Acidimicrobiia bacterium]
MSKFNAQIHLTLVVVMNYGNGARPETDVPELVSNLTNEIHIFSRHGAYTVEDGKRIDTPGWYPAAYGSAARLFPDRKTHLWFCGEGSNAQLAEFRKDDEPHHIFLPGYNEASRNFANGALWGCLRERIPNVPNHYMQRGFKEFLEFSLATAEKASELPDNSTLIFQDYQFILLPGLINGTIDGSMIARALTGVASQDEIDSIVQRLEVVQSRAADKNFAITTFLHTSLPHAQYWDELNDGIGMMMISSVMSESVGVHSPNWQLRLAEAHIRYEGDPAALERIFTSPIGMDATGISEFLESNGASYIRESLERDNLGDDIILISGRADPKNAISDVLAQIKISYESNPELWKGKTLVLQVPPDGKEGCERELAEIETLVAELQEMNFPKVQWYKDNNRDRSLVLAEKANVFIAGAPLGGFEVVTLEAIFANPNSVVICSNGIGSAYVLDGLSKNFNVHDDLQTAFEDILPQMPLTRSVEERAFIDELRASLTPQDWLHHLVGVAEQHQTPTINSRNEFLAKCFANSGLEIGTLSRQI